MDIYIISQFQKLLYHVIMTIPFWCTLFVDFIWLEKQKTTINSYGQNIQNFLAPIVGTVQSILTIIASLLVGLFNLAPQSFIYQVIISILGVFLLVYILLFLLKFDSR